MKLPPIGFSAPQDLGRLSPDAAALPSLIAAKGWAAVGKAAEDFQETHDRFQEQEATIKLTKHIQDWQSKQIGKEYYTADEVPEAIQLRRTDQVVDADGNVTEVTRSQIPAYEVFPNMYKHEMDSAISAYGAGIDNARVREMWSGIQTNKAGVQYIASQAAAFKAQKDQIRLAQENNINRAVMSGDMDMVRSLISEFNGTTEEKKMLTQKATHQHEINVISNAIATGDVTEMERAIDYYSNPKNASELQPKERLAWVDTLKRKSAEHVSSRAAQKKMAEDLEVSNFQLQIDKGQGTEAEALKLFERGLINGPTLTAMRAEMLRRSKQVVATSISVTGLRNSIKEGGFNAVPGDPALRAIVNDDYVATLKANPQLRAEVTKDFIGTFQIIPEEVQKTWKASNRDNGTMLENAAMEYLWASQNHPNALQDVDSSAYQRIKAVSAYVTAGMTPKEAVTALLTQEKLTPQQKEGYKAVAKLYTKDPKMVEKDIVRAFNIPLFTANPQPDAVLMAEYTNKIDRYLPEVGGDVELAKARASQDIKERWGYTKINGKAQLIHYAPRMNDTEWRDVLTDKYGEKPVMIQSDEITASHVLRYGINGPRSFRVLRVDPTTQAVEELPRWVYNPSTITKEVGDARVKAAKALRSRQPGALTATPEEGEPTAVTGRAK